MNVVICYACEYFSLVATDTVSEKPKSGGSALRDVHSGWIAGVGQPELIADFQNAMGDFELVQGTDAISVFLQIYDHFSRSKACNQDVLSRTVLAHSWMGVAGEHTGLPGIFNISLYSKETVFKRNIPTYIDQNRITILYPDTFLTDPDKIHDLEAKYCLDYEYDNDFGKLHRLILFLFKEISSQSEAVTDHMDIGILYADISGVKKLRIKGQIDQLIREMTQSLS